MTYMVLGVHIADGIVPGWWATAGYMAAASLVWFGSLERRRPKKVADTLRWLLRPNLGDDELPRVAVMASAFFVASLIHVPFWPTSVHLLLGGLVGILLGRRALPAIALGLLFHWALLGHGGITTLGVNCVLIGVPALMAAGVYRVLRDRQGLARVGIQAAVVGILTAGWLLAAAFCVMVLVRHDDALPLAEQLESAARATVGPILLGAAALGVAAAAIWQIRRPMAVEFILGLLSGGLAALGTAAFACGFLLLIGKGEWRIMAFTLLIAHLPVAVLEALITGFALQFLAKVKPEMLYRPGERSARPLPEAAAMP